MLHLKALNNSKLTLFEADYQSVHSHEPQVDFSVFLCAWS